MVPVGAFADNDDVGAFINAVFRIRRKESHGFHIFVQVVIELLQELEFAARGVQGFEDGGRKYMGNLPVESAEEEDGNHKKPDREGFPAASKDISFKTASSFHHGAGQDDGAGNDDAKGNDRHCQVHGGTHGAEEVLDFLQMGGAHRHHGKHVHFTAEEHVVADVDEGDKYHEEGVNPCDDCPESGKAFCPGSPGGVHIGKGHEKGAQHVVVAQMFFLRQGGKAVGPGKGAHPEKGQNHRPGKEGLQIFPVHHGKKAEGYDQEDQKRRSQPRLYVAVDVGEVPAQMEQRHNHQRRGYHPGKGG